VNSGEMADSIKMPFGVVDPRKCIRWGPDLQWEGASFEGKWGSTM